MKALFYREKVSLRFWNEYKRIRNKIHSPPPLIAPRTWLKNIYLVLGNQRIFQKLRSIQSEFRRKHFRRPDTNISFREMGDERDAERQREREKTCSTRGETVSVTRRDTKCHYNADTSESRWDAEGKGRRKKTKRRTRTRTKGTWQQAENGVAALLLREDKFSYRNVSLSTISKNNRDVRARLNHVLLTKWMYFMKSHLGKVWKIFVTFIRQIITKFRDGVLKIDILLVFAVGNEKRRGE